MTCSPAVGLPLGFIIILSESEKILIVKFEKLKAVLMNYACYTRGKKKGSKLFMTDDADAEINGDVCGEATIK